jgi:hypothetical protein
MFASSVILNGAAFTSEGVYVSTNGGLNWSGSDTCKGQNISNHGGDPSIMIDKFGKFVITHIGNPSVQPGVYSHFSTNNGVSWSNASTITTQQPEDKGSSILDYNSLSPNYGNIYAVWVNLNLLPYSVQFASSSNSGQSWLTPVTVNPGNTNRCSGGSVITGPDGKIYITWAGLSGVSPFIEVFAGFATSTNAGLNWNFTQNIFDMTGIAGTLTFPQGSIRTNGLPQVAMDVTNGPFKGWLYIVTTEKNRLPAGSDPDIIFHRSTDGGTTWSQGIRVNQDPLNNGKLQYFPSMCIDSLGGIDIIFYDNRNTSNDSMEVFIARSKDGGNTWFEKAISDHRLQPKPILGGSSLFQGDHIAINTVNNKIYALWMDNYSGIYQNWIKIIDLSTIGIINISQQVPDKFKLLQNYPNPFNPSTNIQFRIQKSGNVKLDVFDITGKLVATLVNQKLSYGTYEVKYSGISSGIYLYRLTTDDFMQTKKMIEIK